MKNIFLFIGLIFLGSCSSSDDGNGQTNENLADLLTQNAWVDDRTEILDITSHGSLTYAEAEQILLEFPLKPSESGNSAIYSFDTDGTGTIRVPNTNINTINFGWIILPDNTLRIFLSSNLENLGVYEFTVTNDVLTLTDDREYLYNGTLIKYRAKFYLNKQ